MPGDPKPATPRSLRYATIHVAVERELPSAASLPDQLKLLGLADQSQEGLWVIAYDSIQGIRTVVEVARGNYDAMDVSLPAVLSVPLLVACEVGLLVSARRDDLATVVPVLWVLHNSVFAILTLFIGIALFGLARASHLTGLIPSVIARISAVGALLLAANTALAPIVADRASPVMAVGLVGFIGWLVFVVAASLGMRRPSR